MGGGRASPSSGARPLGADPRQEPPGKVCGGRDGVLPGALGFPKQRSGLHLGLRPHRAHSEEPASSALISYLNQGLFKVFLNQAGYFSLFIASFQFYCHEYVCMNAALYNYN